VRPGRKSGFTLIELMIVIAIIAIIAAIAIPGILNAMRTANERNASGSMKHFQSEQTLFKTADGDSNGNSDYWIGDIAGLYRIASANSSVNQGIKLVEPSVASADAAPITAATATSWGVNYSSVTSIGTWSPKAGYWFRVLVNHQIGAVTMAYNAGGRGRNFDRFGVIAVPHSYLGSGKLIFILNEEGTHFKRDAGAQIGSGTNPNPGCWLNAASVPVPGPTEPAGVSAVDTWPRDPLDVGWSKMD
jgi:prepilin-type N-terminal cleavage/methylation domain-containing protein